MVTVEGVARRIDPHHDIWAAADPVVRRWITRELSPPARIQKLAEDGLAILEGIARHAKAPTGPAVVTLPPPAASRLAWFALGCALSALALAIAAFLR
jgi:ubiquinone biosynthesis protein